MIDYSSMSDFEINKRVAVVLGYRLYKDGSSHQKNCVAVQDPSGKDAYAMEWCNNPSKAWEILYDNEISIVNTNHGEWTARYGSLYYDHENPLRAAMIVYLMMQHKQRQV